MHSTHAYLPAMLSLSLSLPRSIPKESSIGPSARFAPSSSSPVAEECKAAVEGMEWSGVGGDRREGGRVGDRRGESTTTAVKKASGEEGGGAGVEATSRGRGWASLLLWSARERESFGGRFIRAERSETR